MKSCQSTAFCLLLGSLLYMAVPVCHAQTGLHSPRSGDLLIHHLTGYTPEAEVSSEMVWDLRGLDLSDDCSTVTYNEAFGREGMIAGTEHNTRFYYGQQRDTLLLWGYENNLLRADYTHAELLLRTPLVHGDTHHGLLHGTLGYCESMFFRVVGRYSSEVDGSGMMILPTGDTLHHVSRVHLTEQTALLFYPHVTTYRQLQSYADSIPFPADSIQSALVQQPVQEVHRYFWYARGYRYPILESVSLGSAGADLHPCVSYYCAPEEQELLADEDNALIRQQLSDGSAVPSNGSGSSPLSRCDVQVHGGTVTVSYDLVSAATVMALVCNTGGMVFLQQKRTDASGDGYQLSLDCHSLRSGEYVLYLNANGHVLQMKISL